MAEVFAGEAGGTGGRGGKLGGGGRGGGGGGKGGCALWELCERGGGRTRMVVKNE